MIDLEGYERGTPKEQAAAFACVILFGLAFWAAVGAFVFGVF